MTTKITSGPKFKILLFTIFCVTTLFRNSTYTESTIADESHFYHYAENIIQGFYADPVNPNLLDGPGYPLFLAVPLALGLPLFALRLLNIFFLFFASCYLLKVLQAYISPKLALTLTFIFALYPPTLRWANLLYSEPFMLFLLLGFAFHFISWYRTEQNSKKHFILSILFLGYLALTKIIFSYVIVAFLAMILLVRVFPKLSEAYKLKKVTLIIIGSLALFSPYVIYTYSLTGKFFYLGTHGGITLYSRATPFENEYGNWLSERYILNADVPTGRGNVMANMEQLKENHGKLFERIDSLTWIEKDSILKEEAIENMKKHPKKYLKNTVANISRIFFHFPFSYRMQNLDTLGYLIPNIFIAVLAILGIYPAIARFRKIPKELVILFLISLIYLGGHTLLDGRGRYLIPVVPIWLIFYSFVYTRVLSIKFKD